MWMRRLLTGGLTIGLESLFRWAGQAMICVFFGLWSIDGGFGLRVRCDVNDGALETGYG